MSLHGAYRKDGSWIGFDYDRQVWIDTDPKAERDQTRKLGSAGNPLPTKQRVTHPNTTERAP